MVVGIVLCLGRHLSERFFDKVGAKKYNTRRDHLNYADPKNGFDLVMVGRTYPGCTKMLIWKPILRNVGTVVTTHALE